MPLRWQLCTVFDPQHQSQAVEFAVEEEAALLNGLDSIVGGAFGERIGGCVVGMSPLLACLQTSPIVA